MPSRNALVIDIGRMRLRALLAQREGGVLRVKRTVVQDVPTDLDRDNPDEVGEWVGRTLRDGGISRGKAVIALAREHVVLKRLTLPTNDETELPDMTRLAMGRELPFDAQGAVIDFVPVDKADTSTTVLAVAVKQEVLDYTLRLAKAAKFGIDRVSIRNLGSALLLRHLDAPGRKSASILAVDIIGESIEFCVVEPAKSAVRFSRAADGVPWRDVDLMVDSVITETRRTWMSYRISEDSSEVRHAVIMGDRRVTSEVARPLGEMLDVDAEVLSAHPLVDPSGHEMDRLWPLAGLLLEPIYGGETIDFAKPRKAPDLTAARRKRSFVASAVCVLLLLSAWTVAKRDLDSLRAQVHEAQQRRSAMYPEYVRHGREEYRLEHIRQWESVGVDWLEHLMYQSTIAPPPDQVVLDNWSGQMQFRRGVQFDRTSREWSAPRQIIIDVSGEARDRATADAFRDALVRTEVYRTTSTGTDAAGGRRLPHGFSYRLRTEKSAPASGAPESAQSRAGASGGTS